MTREEQIKEAAIGRYGNNGNESQYMLGKIQAFIVGARYADEHPNGSIIKWQAGEPKENGFYMVSYQFPNSSRANVTALVYTGKTWINGDWQEIDKTRITAWCKLSDIKPYKEGTNSNRPFKIGDLVVENQIVGVVVELQNEGMLKVIGAALMKMHFHERMCRKATNDEALSINARWREQGFYYDINTDNLQPYK